MAIRNEWTRKTAHNGEINPHSGKKVWHIDVKPIRNQSDLVAFIKYLRERSSVGQRNALAFEFGVYTGLRVSDVMQIETADVINTTQAHITEQKTGKERIIYLDNILSDIITYQASRTDSSRWLFPSSTNPDRHLSSHTFYQQLNEAADAMGMQHIGTHTMRKTFGYMYYQKYHDLATLMKIFNHTSEAITLRYIGLEAEHIESSLKDFKPFD